MSFFTKIADTALTVSFYLLFFLTPFIFSTSNSELFELPKMIFVYFLTTVIVGSWVVKSVAAGRLIFKKTFLDIPLILFLLSQTLSTIFSIDRHTSFWGYYSRSNGGLLSTVAYLALYWAYVSNMTPTATARALRCLLASATLVAVWAILEHFGGSPSCLLIKGEWNTQCWVEDVQLRAFATLGQPNWLAAFLVAILPLTWHKLLTSPRLPLFHSYTLPLLYSSTLILFLALLFTQSRSGFLGFLTAFFVFWSLALPTIPHFSPRSHSGLRGAGKILIPLVACYLLLIALFGSPFTPALINKILPPPPARSTATSALELVRPESTKIRTIVWRGALDIWKSYPFLGTGVETFAYSYYWFRPVEHNQTIEWDFLYNKAHNEYLNFLANSGIVGLGTYLLLIGSLVFSGIKKFKLAIYNLNSNLKLKIENLNLLTYALFSGYASILVTNFFGFSVVNTALLFFLFPAIAITLSDKKQAISNKFHLFPTPKLISYRLSLVSYFSFLVAIILTSYVLLRTVQIWLADRAYTNSGRLERQELYSLSLAQTRTALALRPDEPLYYDQLAKVSSRIAVDLAEQKAASDSAKAADLANDSSAIALSISPYSLNLLKSRAAIFIRLSLVDEKYLAQATPPLEQAVKLAPTDPLVRYNLGVLYQRLGQNKQAQKTLEEAINLKPDYYDARTGLAKIYTTLGEKQPAAEQLEYILKNLNSGDQEAQTMLEELTKKK